MNFRFALVLLSVFGGQATLTATTSYSFGSSSNLSFASETTPYTAGSWTEAFTGGANTSEQIDCVVGITNPTKICGSPGPGSSVNINIPSAPTNQGILPNGTTNYLIVDGDNTYGAPVYTDMTALVVGATYLISFYQATSEETGNNQQDTDNWNVYILPGASTGEYICPTCSTPVDPGSIAPTFTSTPVANPGGPSSTPWALQTFTYKATSTTAILEFVTNAVTTTPGGTVEPPFLALAGVQSSELPEPGTWTLTLLGAGFVLAGLKLRRRSSAEYKRVKRG
jgi:hypothetical protein